MPRPASTTNRPGPDEHALAQRVQAGDYEAFRTLFNRYYHDLVRYAHGFVASHDLAEGLVQEAFVGIWNGRDHWQPAGALRTYLYATVRNRCLSYLRKRKRRSRLAEQWWPEAEPATAADADDLEFLELRHAAERAVAALPRRRRDVYVLSRHHGLTYQEIAALMDISVKTVEAHMGKALRTLRKQLAPFVQGPS